MPAYFTIDVMHSSHWYQWDLVTTREAADRLFKQYLDDDTFDDVAITLHTTRSCMQLQAKSDMEELPW